MSIKSFSFTLLLLSIHASLIGQNDTKLGNWFMYNGSHKIAENWKIESMAHFRYYEFANDFQQEIYRLATNYSLHKKLNASIGYSYVRTDLTAGATETIIYENRLYEDINYINFVSKLKIRHRFRFEHRFLRTNFTNSDSHWFRYDLNIRYPISKNLAVYAFNELFLNIDEKKRFVQNWSGFGLLKTINKTLTLNAGFLSAKFPNETQNRLLLGIILNTNHSK